MKAKLKFGAWLLFSCLLACNMPSTPKEKTNQPPATPTAMKKMVEWAKNAVIYEVNTRQHTKEGTFKALEADLPRLKKMGVDILWLMPIHQIGLKNRKKTPTDLGSPYSAVDYKGVNPDFGTLDDFKSLVKKAHELGMKVILDWVANHTAWDAVWIKDHKDWYTQDEKGNIIVPRDPNSGNSTGWDDVADLNYDNKEMRKAMIDAMQYWIKEADIDGYRCDVAGFVPTDFWNDVRTELDKTKPVFMLAEWESPDLMEKAFDMFYSWNLHHNLHQVALGKEKATKIDTSLEMYHKKYPKDAVPMTFITNHDENSWNGSVKEKFGDGGDAFAVLTFTMEGMPLLYTGQEADNAKRLEFFVKDAVDWKNYPKQDFYTKLIALRHENKALYCGEGAAPMLRIKSSNDDAVYAFLREKENNRVFVIANLSKTPQKISLQGEAHHANYKEYFSAKDITFDKTTTINLKAWEYAVYIKK